MIGEVQALQLLGRQEVMGLQAGQDRPVTQATLDALGLPSAAALTTPAAFGAARSAGESAVPERALLSGALIRPRAASSVGRCLLDATRADQRPDA